MGNLEEFKSSVEWITILPTATEDYLAVVLLGKMWANCRFILGGGGEGERGKGEKKKPTEKPRTKVSIIF